MENKIKKSGIDKESFYKIVNDTENDIVNLIKLKNINNLDNFYDLRLNNNKIFCNADIELSKLTTMFFPNKSIKILELGGGICQLSILLYKLGYKNIFPTEHDKIRVNCLNYLNKELNIHIKNEFLGKDFFNIDTDKFDLIITQNLKWQRKDDIQRYNEFLFYKKFVNNGGILLYCDICDNEFIDNEIKKCFDIGFYFNQKNNIKFVYKKNLNINSVCDISYYTTISFSNIFEKLINTNNENIIKLEFKEEISPSAGIFIPIFYILHNIDNTKINKYRLSFDIKIETPNDNSKIKIYTGIKWIELDKKLTTEYQTIELIDNFNFSTTSTYRIGFINMVNNILYLKNISLIVH